MEKLIKGFKNGTIEIDEEYSIHEVEFTDGVSERYIEHNVLDDEIVLLFAEHEEALELRSKIAYAETEDEKRKLEDEYRETFGGEPEDEFNYDEPVAYKDQYSKINWA